MRSRWEEGTLAGRFLGMWVFFCCWGVMHPKWHCLCRRPPCWMARDQGLLGGRRHETRNVRGRPILGVAFYAVVYLAGQRLISTGAEPASQLFS